MTTTTLRNVGIRGHTVRWSATNLPNPALYSAGVYVDGVLSARAPASSGMVDIEPPTPGTHTIAVHCQPTLAPWPDRHGEPQGQRIFLTWAPSTDPTTRGYRVYIDGTLSGTITTPTIIAPTETTTRARIKIYGDPPATTAVNIAASVVISAPNTATVLGTTIAIAAGLSVPLPHGVWITFLDDPADYTTNDAYPFHVGPANTFLSEPIAPGTYACHVTAIDAAGNESSALTQRSIRILDIPSEATLTAVYVSTTAITFTPSAPCNVYTNFDLATNTWWPHIITTNPWRVHTTGSFTFTAPTPGTLLIQCRATSALIERSEATIHSFTFPPTPADLGIILGAPTGATATPIADGFVRVDWFYRYRIGDTITSCRIEWGDTDAYDIDFDVLPPSLGVGYPVAKFSYTIDASAITTLYIRITARAGTNVSAAVTLTATPDATPPTFSGITLGVTQ